MTLYQKAITAYGILREEISSKMSDLSVAGRFSEGNSYDAGDLTIKDNVLYMCLVAHSGPWSDDDFSQSTIEQAIKFATESARSYLLAHLAEKSCIASEFDTERRYLEGDLVFNDGVLFVCVSEHSPGSWNEDFMNASIDDVIASLCPIRRIASDFSENEDYEIGQLVVKDRKLYTCISGHESDEWDASHFIPSTVDYAISLKTSFADVHKIISDGHEKIDMRDIVIPSEGTTIDIGTVSDGSLTSIRFSADASSGAGTELSVGLPNPVVDGNGNYNTTSARIMIDLTNITEVVPDLSIGGSLDEVVWSDSMGHLSGNMLNDIDISFVGTRQVDGANKRMWAARIFTYPVQ